jgi:hypothetical protein
VKSNPGSVDASDYTTDRALLGLSVSFSSSGSAAIGAAALILTEVTGRPRLPNVSRLEMNAGSFAASVA